MGRTTSVTQAARTLKISRTAQIGSGLFGWVVMAATSTHWPPLPRL
jgi:hypothetical protein